MSDDKKQTKTELDDKQMEQVTGGGSSPSEMCSRLKHVPGRDGFCKRCGRKVSDSSYTPPRPL